MNELENFIVEIYSEEMVFPPKGKYPELSDKEFVKVKVKLDCCGGTRIETELFEKEFWEEAKRKGYYMG